MVKLTINDQVVEVEEGTTVLKACSAAGVDVPTLCYVPFLEPYGACRMCTVKVSENGSSRLTTACTLQAAEGMKIITDDDDVRKARKVVLELLLARAPDAEILQEMAAEYGIEKSRFVIEEEEPAEEAGAPEAEAEAEGELEIEKKPKKCILCGSCYRVCEQRVQAFAIGLVERGADAEIAPPFGRPSDNCIACGACASVCPTGAITAADRLGREIVHDELTLAPNSAIKVPIKQAVPNVPYVDKEQCIHFTQAENGLDACRVCEDICPKEAVDLDAEDEEVELDVGTIILATGFKTFDPRRIRELGYGMLPNVISALEFELMMRADGQTEGELLMENGEKPKSIAILHCVGSRDKNYNRYCSRVCCMYSLKFAHLIKEKTDADVFEFYIDMRSFGKGYEEFYDRLLEEGVFFIRGRGAEVTHVAERPEEEGKLVVCCEDTLIGAYRRVPVDMVVLATGLEPREDADEVRRTFGIGCGAEGFFTEKHAKLAPVSTTTDGVFLAGACQGPKDIPDSVAQGSAAAAQALALMDKGLVEIEPITSVIDENVCCGCKICIGLCPYTAISFDEEKKVSVVNEALCKGCGTCVAACTTGAANQRHFKNEQILAEIEGVLS
jgi:heterodisulfide reductase subunit A-like polyferredoxin/ferredoxin